MEQVKARDDKLELLIAGIQPMLDFVGLEQPEGARLPGDGSYRIGGLQGVRTQRRPWILHPCTHATTVTLPFSGSPTGGDRVCIGHGCREDL